MMQHAEIAQECRVYIRSAWAPKAKSMRIAHILRKYNPAEWGGTETAVQQLLDGLRAHRTESVVYCPRTTQVQSVDPLRDTGHQVERFRAFLPVWRIPAAQRRQLVSVGGNLMSLDLIWKL